MASAHLLDETTDIQHSCRGLTARKILNVLRFTSNPCRGALSASVGVPTEPEFMHKGALGAMAYIRLGSGGVERQHLLGQELYQPNGRGVASSACTLVERTYH